MKRCCRRVLFSLGCLLLLAGCGESPKLSLLSSDAVILAFGDSLTYGTGATPEQSYPSVLSQLSGRKVINAGVPGEVSAEGLARLPQLLDQHQPSLLLLCHGGNDLLRKKSSANLRTNLLAMVEAARSRNIPVLLIGVPRPSLLLSTEPLYQELAEKLAIPYQGDVIADILGDNRLKSDTVHPNALGYQQLAETLTNELKRLGAL